MYGLQKSWFNTIKQVFIRHQLFSILKKLFDKKSMLPKKLVPKKVVRRKNNFVRGYRNVYIYCNLNNLVLNGYTFVCPANY